MLLVWRMRQDIKVAETRLLVDAVLIASQPPDSDSNKQVKEDWNMFVHSVFPFKKQQEKTDDQRVIEFLHRQVAEGPMRVTPLTSPFKRRP